MTQTRQPVTSQPDQGPARPAINYRPQVDTGFLGINWGVRTPSLRFYRFRPLARLLAWWELRSSPRMDGPRDLSDLLAPGQQQPASIPAYYLFNPVHRMSADGLGWMHPRMGRRYERMAEDFTYAARENIEAWIRMATAGLPPPRRIIDLATGTGVNAFVYAELFPDAEVVGIDIAPSLLRWARHRAEQRGMRNLRFYHMDCADLSYFPDDHFDIVHEGMVFHEMPAPWILRTLREMVRVARPGGLLGFSDWRIPGPEETGQWRKYAAQARAGVEPFMVEYARTNWPERLRELGCTVEQTDQAANSATWRAIKGPDAGRLLVETASWPSMQGVPPAEPAILGGPPAGGTRPG